MQKLAIDSPIGGGPVYYVEETGSTMDEARALVAAGAENGLVVVTDHQTTGRGRLAGRVWQSPPRMSLMFTVAHHDSQVATAPLRAGLAVSSALEHLFALRPRLKWPNDVLVSGRKICGVLCEYTAPWLYIGVGLNLWQLTFPGLLAASATSVARELAAAGRNLAPEPGPEQRDEVLRRILEEIGTPPENWVDHLNNRLWRKDSPVEITDPVGTVLRGTVDRIDPDGALVLVVDGSETRVVAGELSYE